MHETFPRNEWIESWVRGKRNIFLLAEQFTPLVEGLPLPSLILSKLDLTMDSC